MATVLERKRSGSDPAVAGRRHHPPAMASARSVAHGESPAPTAVADWDTGPNRDGVQELIDWARTERAHLGLLSLDRAYYLGIEVAAEQVLHPDVEAMRTVAWF